jgi:hypothetical protein
MQCCQMVCICSYQKSNLGVFWRALECKMLEFLWPFRIFDRPLVFSYSHLVHVVVIWYIFYRFGKLYLEKSGNTGNLSWFIESSLKYYHPMFIPAGIHLKTQKLQTCTYVLCKKGDCNVCVCICIFNWSLILNTYVSYQRFAGKINSRTFMSNLEMT